MNIQSAEQCSSVSFHLYKKRKIPKAGISECPRVPPSRKETGKLEDNDRKREIQSSFTYDFESCIISKY